VLGFRTRCIRRERQSNRHDGGGDPLGKCEHLLTP
jgi:hypothetical protein